MTASTAQVHDGDDDDDESDGGHGDASGLEELSSSVGTSLESLVSTQEGARSVRVAEQIDMVKDAVMKLRIQQQPRPLAPTTPTLDVNSDDVGMGSKSKMSTDKIAMVTQLLHRSKNSNVVAPQQTMKSEQSQQSTKKNNPFTLPDHAS